MLPSFPSPSALRFAAHILTTPAPTGYLWKVPADPSFPFLLKTVEIPAALNLSENIRFDILFHSPFSFSIPDPRPNQKNPVLCRPAAPIASKAEIHIGC